MKQYLQITVVFLVFGLLILLRNLADHTTNPQVVNQSTPHFNNNADAANNQNKQRYKDGTYTGSVEDAYYGNVQVKAAILAGKIKNIVFLQYPNDNETSRFVNDQAMPALISEAIKAQSAQVDIVTGASQTSEAFQRSLAQALNSSLQE